MSIDSEGTSTSEAEAPATKGRKASKKPKPAKKASRAKKTGKPKADRANKKAEMIAMMKRAKGASRREIMVSTSKCA